MTCECPTCQCDHAGTFPRFSFYYTDGKVYRGGGPEDLEQTVFSLPRSFVEMPAFGVGIGLVEDPVVGRFTLRGKEQYYALAPQTRGGPALTFSGVESRLLPAMSGQYGIVKLGEYMSTDRYYELIDRSKSDEHVRVKSANLDPAMVLPAHED